MTMDMPHLSDESIKEFAMYELDLINIACTLFQDTNPTGFLAKSKDNQVELIEQLSEFFNKRLGNDVDAKTRIKFFNWLICKCISLQAVMYSSDDKNILQEFIAEGFLFTQMLEDTSLFDQSHVDEFNKASDE